MKYIVMMEYDNKLIDTVLRETDSELEAVEEAFYTWYHLTGNEWEHTEYLVVLESYNPDENAEDHYDGDVIVDFKQNYRVKSGYQDRFYGEADAWYVDECQTYGIPVKDIMHMMREYGVKTIRSMLESF